MLTSKKGSTLAWAIMVIFILMVIVGASLTLANVNYNKTIKNGKEIQAEMIAKSAVDSISTAIKDDPTKLVPTVIGKSTTISSVKLPDSLGDVSSASVTKKANDEIEINVSVVHGDVTYTLKGTMMLKEGQWVLLSYDGGDF